ncbi:ribosomal-processing cysteine protease Prp [Mechercharimyces sp. CAU 1602]|uniref:ribosomal-processing cysteine protease Prp n=1 Tax=Mechercharimyces sp. CAU 1602 TaxID=2973933 RepID=UPI002162D147|nr:ribosomal-processing cysteine protease Prp [Mechercharimyces sp. CAU 1602]MCS1351429.1 ribosomal-processing cysteine protease Prp [Mechercharimyces sp. CAU 1602]
MIHITVYRDRQERLQRVLVTGHAEYAEYGSDIVCAAVSAVTIGLANACEELLGVPVHQDDDGDGHVDCRIPQTVDEEVVDSVRLLMEAMVSSLVSIAESYPTYIQLSNERW